jgi:hypothetical protein
MAVVPFVFANRSGSIPLSELDVNFANCKAFAENSGNVTGNIQSNITAVGTLTSLTVSGNVNIAGNISGNITVAGANTQVLFNDNGVANAVSGLTFNKNGNLLSVTGNVVSNSGVIGTVLVSTSGNIGTSSDVVTFRLANNFPTTFFIGGNAGNVFIANANSTTTMAGNVAAGGNISAAGNVLANNLIVSGNIIDTGSLSIVTGTTGNTWTFDTTGNITFPGGGIIRSRLNSGNVGVALFEGSAGGEVSMNWNNNNYAYVDATGTYLQSNGNSVQLNGNLLSVGTSTSVAISATGNVQAANVRSLGVVFGNVCLLTPGFISATGNAIIGGNLSVSGNASAPTAANGTNTTQLATTAFVVNTAQNLIPTGVIVMWSGNIASIPTGWTLCNGGNGTPDLRDRFVVGAGSTYAVAATGGSADAVVVSHTHTASSAVSDPGHAHGYTAPASTGSDATGFDTEIATTTAATTGSANTGITVTTTVNSSGVSGTNANLPPYYALAYIMKL